MLVLNRFYEFDTALGRLACRQPRLAFGVPGSSIACAGQTAVLQDCPRSASSASRHSTSSRSAPPPEKISVTTPAGPSVSANSTASRLSTLSALAGFISRALHDNTRSKRKAERRRRNSGFWACALSQSKRLSATTRRLSRGRHSTSDTLTTASCKWVETISKSSSSRTTNFNWSSFSLTDVRLPCTEARQGPAVAQGVEI